MKKNKKALRKVDKQSKASLSRSMFNEDILACFLIVLYLAVDFIPSFGTIDVMGPQWFYLAIVNLLIGSYVLVNTKYRFTNIAIRFSNNLIILCYIGFFLLSGISIFFAINKIESLVIYTRFMVTLLAFFNIF